MQNFQAGVGEKFYLLFYVGHLVDVPQSYVMFEVSQLDNYGYLFDKPTFISLDPAARPGTIPVAGIRIGVNGAEAAVGQAYRTLNTVVNDSNYVPGGQRLSSIGTVIALEKGPEADEFFLTFDVLGSHTNVRTDPVPLLPEPPPDVPRTADVGLRVFDEINATMSELTGVSTQVAAVDATYQTLKQSMPTVETIETFVSAHPVAIAQLAIQYCNALVNNQGAIPRITYFPGFNFGAPPTTAFGGGGDAIVVNALVGRMVDPALLTDPVEGEVVSELHLLIDQLAPGGTTAARTETVVKATCAALLGSAVTLVQ
jgi:hypothetical protein